MWNTGSDVELLTNDENVETGSEESSRKCGERCKQCQKYYQNSCCCKCCSCCCITLLVFLILFMTGALRWVPVGANSVPFGYATDMVSLLLTKGVPGYPDAWCGGNSITALRSCNIKENFPGPSTTSYMDWDDVWQMGSQYPSKEWSGEWWRGNELGFIINNPKFWSNLGIDPMSILLGASPKQHAAIRPVVENMWLGEKGPNMNEKEIIRRRIRELFERKSIEVPTDITIMVHQILNEIGLKRKVSYEYSQKFVSLQAKVVALGTLSQLVPSVLAGVTLSGISDQVGEYVQEYIPLMQKLYGTQLGKEDCGPSVNCTVQAAVATWDALYSAGGLSVPGTISTGLGLLYSTDKRSPAPGITYRKDQAAEFYWENIRYFPPVVGFPHWSTRPTCAGSSAEDTASLNKSDGMTEPCKLGKPSFFTGYPTVNQYMGGVRHVPNLALAMWDPRKWGDNSNQFVLRPLDEYDKYSVGFAEMAVDNDVAEGRMNRICPGKTLALSIGTLFFEELDLAKWTTDDFIGWKGATPFVGSFTLRSA